MTSASGRQVKSILWAEVRNVARDAKVKLGPQPALDPNTGIELAGGRRIQGFSTDKPERMAGISGANVLFIIDEASGVDQAIFDAIEGNRAGGARVVLFSNPTQTSGEFFDAFHSKRAFYHCLHVSSEESPNVSAGRVVVPGLATAGWVEEKRREWGVGSPIYAVRVRGDFPPQSSNSVISLALVDKAVETGLQRWIDLDKPLDAGLDVARYGDDESVLCVRRGRNILGFWTWQHLDGPTLAREVWRVLDGIRKPGTAQPRVKVDVIGVGASAYDALKGDTPLQVVPVNVAERSDDPERYVLLRDQLWFAMADWLVDGGIPRDDKLHGELVAPLYGFDARGRYKVESKDEIKSRIGRSPDRADALALAVYTGNVARFPKSDKPSSNDDEYRFGHGRGY